jgi:hypothetical protein
MDGLNKNLDSFAARCFQTSMKQYFEISQDYARRKLLFLIFPFSELKKKEDTPTDDIVNEAEEGQKNRAVTDTDLYLPLMSFVTYILLVCLTLGLNGK